MSGSHNALPFIDMSCRTRLPENIRRLFGQVHVELGDEARCRLSIRASSVGDWWFSWIEGSGKIIISTDWRALRLSDCALLTMSLKGENRSLRHGVISAPGRIVLSQWPTADAVISSGDFSYLCAYVPRHLLEAPEAQEIPYGSSLDTGHGSGAVVGAAMTSITREVTHAADTGVAEILPDFLQMTLRSLKGASGVAESTEIPQCWSSRAVRLRGYVEAHFADPELSPAQVAVACGTSPRQLYREFQREGISFESLVRDLRLQHARNLLTDNLEEPVTQVAYASGFKNLTVFTRLFKQRFGQPPSAYRASAVEAQIKPYSNASIAGLERIRPRF